MARLSAPPRPARWAVAGALLALGGACASPSSVAVDPEARPVSFLLEEGRGDPGREAEYVAPDGARLGLVEYRCASPRAAVVYLHGIQSHAGWFEAAARSLREAGFDVFCLDRRGSGINRENRGFTSGHVDRYPTLLEDLAAFVRPLRERYERVFLIGQSWGGKLTTAYALERPGDVDGLVLVTPGLVPQVDLSLTAKVGVFLGTVFHPRSQVRIPIAPEMMTRSPRWLEKIRLDPLRIEHVSARFFWEGRGLDHFIASRLPRNRVPILLLLAEGDRIIDNEAVVSLLRSGGGGLPEILEYEDQAHSIQLDATDRLAEDLSRWFGRRLAQARPASARSEGAEPRAR